MEIPGHFLKSVLSSPILSVLHVGAHKGEELLDYEALGVTHVTWVEAQEKLVHELRENLPTGKHTVLQGAIWDVSGVKMQLQVTSNSMSSSLLELGTHTQKYPEISVSEIVRVNTIRLDDLLDPSDSFDFVNLDIQGAELRALQSMGTLLQHSKYVYCEVNREELYKGASLWPELRGFLTSNGFELVMVSWRKEGWGDALFSRPGYFSRFGRAQAKLRMFFRRLLGRRGVRVLFRKLRHIQLQGKRYFGRRK